MGWAADVHVIMDISRLLFCVHRAAPSGIDRVEMAYARRWLAQPGKAGTFVIRAKFPADYAVPAHWHPTDEKVTVLSGKLHYAMTDKLDMANAKTLTAGHSVTMKAKMNHWVHAPVATTIQVSGKGPFVITYVDPKDDPRTK